MILRCGNTVENKLYLPAIKSAKVQEEPSVQKVETASVPTATRVSAPICTPYDMTEECLARIQEAPRQEVRYTQGTLHADELPPSERPCVGKESVSALVGSGGLSFGITDLLVAGSSHPALAIPALVIGGIATVYSLTVHDSDPKCVAGGILLGGVAGVIGGRSIHTSTTSPATTTTSGSGTGPVNQFGGGPANQGN
mgnify:FL=1